MCRILIVEDEEKLARYIELELQHEGYETFKTGNGLDAVRLVSGAIESGKAFDLVLLDIMLPGINGMEVLRRINMNEAEAPPVIMLTARDQVMDKVAGLDAGAADYMTKPFAIEELLARIRAALKRKERSGNGHSGVRTEDQPGTDENVLRHGALVLDDKKHRVTYDGEIITLTNREFIMLKTLLENRDIVLSRDVLLSKVCGYDYAGETNVIDVYVRYLRSKIDEAYGVKLIQTVRGVGYVIYSE